MDIETTLLEIEGVSRLAIHDLMKLSFQDSNITIVIAPQSDHGHQKVFNFCDANFKSLIVDPSCAERVELPWTILGIHSRELANDRLEYCFRFEDTEFVFDAKWPTRR